MAPVLDQRKVMRGSQLVECGERCRGGVDRLLDGTSQSSQCAVV
jgi:hypothetical protein